MSNEEIMQLAMREAQIAADDGNAPFGCVVTDIDGNVMVREHDRVKEQLDPTAHGEINAIRKLCRDRKSLSLKGCTFFTTSETCPSCMAGMIKAKVSQVYYGAKTEPTASLPIPAETMAAYSKRHRIEVQGGILTAECLEQRTRLTQPA